METLMQEWVCADKETLTVEEDIRKVCNQGDMRKSPWPGIEKNTHKQQNKSPSQKCNYHILFEMQSHSINIELPNKMQVKMIQAWNLVHPLP